MDHLEFVGQAEKAFRVADEQIAFGIQAAIQLFHQTLLFRFIEIDHHIAAEDHVITLGQEFSFQIMKVKVDQVFESPLDGVAFADFIELAQPVCVIH